MKKKIVTIADIEAIQGILKREPGEKPMTQELLEEHAAEVAKDEAKFADKNATSLSSSCTLMNID